MPGRDVSEGRVLTLERTRYDAEYGQLLEVIYNQQSACLRPILDLIELTWEQFGQRLRSTGTAYRICLDGKLAGVCWVELRNKTLTLLGLNVSPQCQGQGIATRVLERLEQVYAGRGRWIELQVHASNHSARRLYERCGYQIVGYDERSGFYTMRKTIRRRHINSHW